MARSFRYTLAIAGVLGWACQGPVLAAGPVAEAARLVIPAGSLDRALQALATQSRVQILYAPGLVEHRRASGLQAQLPPEQALSILLQGSGLRAERVNANTFVITQAPVPAVAASEPSHAPVELETVQVTGTHIPRASLDIVTPVPRTVITRAQIDASGYQTVFELLSYQPGMVSHHPVDVATEGGFRSQQPFAAAATTSLYGLGPRATLFLVDGRRVANYGLASADLGGMTDLNGIPLSMVERIEIIRGGASAIYGADAMAGVINIVLRKGQDGGEVLASYGLSERGDAQQHRVSFRYGQTTKAGGNLFLGVDYFHRDALEGNERAWRSADLRRLGLGDRRMELGYRSLEDFSLILPACPPEVRDASGACVLDKPRYITLQPEMDSQSVYGHLRQPLGEAVEFYADLRLGQVRQNLQGAPLHGTVILPFGHPDDYYPDGVATILDYAFFDVGPVRSRNRARTGDVGLGLKGDIGRWQWQTDLLHHRSTVDTWIDGLVSNAAFEQSVFDLAYRFNSPDNPKALLSELSPRVEASGEAKLDQWLLAFNGPWFDLPAGSSQAAVGLEWSRDALRNRPDPLMIEHDVALGAQKIAIDDHSYSSALYAELSLPLMQALHADVAVRIDHRQGYGSQTSPMFGLKWNVLPTLTLRGSAATGYRAPSLFELRRPSTDGDFDIIEQTPQIGPCAFSSVSDDGLTYCLVELASIENPDLQPETSRSYTAGFVWAPVPAFDLSLDHFQIRRRNEIVATSAIGNPAAFPKTLERNEDGELVAINDYFENIGRTDVRGWELQSEYRLDTQQRGRFTFRLAGSYLDRLERQLSPDSPTLDYAGYSGPQRALLAGVEWLYEDWNTTLNLHEYGPVNVGQPGQPCPTRNQEVRRCRTPAFTTADLYLAYTGWASWKLSLNINNLTDHEPVNYDPAKGGYDIAYDDPRGRYYLLSAAYRF